MFCVSDHKTERAFAFTKFYSTPLAYSPHWMGPVSSGANDMHVWLAKWCLSIRFEFWWYLLICLLSILPFPRMAHVISAPLNAVLVCVRPFAASPPVRCSLFRYADCTRLFDPVNAPKKHDRCLACYLHNPALTFSFSLNFAYFSKLFSHLSVCLSFSLSFSTIVGSSEQQYRVLCFDENIIDNLYNLESMTFVIGGMSILPLMASPD